MGRLFVLLFFAEIVLAVLALISCLSAEESDIRGLPKVAWVLIILFFPLVGSIAWFLVGRPQTTAARQDIWRPGRGFPEAERPRPQRMAADDDPDFLSTLRKQQREDAELLQRWEDDLRRREEELRRHEHPEN